MRPPRPSPIASMRGRDDPTQWATGPIEARNCHECGKHPTWRLVDCTRRDGRLYIDIGCPRCKRVTSACTQNLGAKELADLVVRQWNEEQKRIGRTRLLAWFST